MAPSSTRVFTERGFVIGILAGVLLMISTMWLLQNRESVADTNNAQAVEKCACAEPGLNVKDADESRSPANRMSYCKCGNLDCVVVKGSFGGFGGTGENYGISCVKR